MKNKFSYKMLANAAFLCMAAFTLISCWGNDKKNNEVAAISGQQDQKIKDFLNEFEVDTADGYKASKYVKQLSSLHL